MIANVLEAMVDAVVVVDLDGRITLHNAAAAEVSGYAPDELRRLAVSALLSDDSSGVRTLARRRIAGGDVLRREVSWLTTKSGERIPVSLTGAPVLDAGGALQGIVIVARDVREVRQLLADKEDEIARRRRAEDELRALNATIETQLDEARRSLLTAERRATLGTLAGGVGHELRNIAQIQIAAIDELSAALAAGEDVTELARSLLPDLERVAEHVRDHGARLLQLARPGPDRVDAHDLNEVVTDVIAMLRGAGALRRHEVTAVLAEPALTVTVNRTRIEQILVNLIVNAVDAITAPAGRITVEVRPSACQTRAVCAVTDDGPGITADVLPRIFQPFFTTKPEGKGTGLGLPVAREIVQSYGGALTVASTPGAGTTFTFDVPR